MMSTSLKVRSALSALLFLSATYAVAAGPIVPPYPPSKALVAIGPIVPPYPPSKALIAIGPIVPPYPPQIALLS